tara:strand:+ start:526 stop:639 length:114 start_codon:yes stop_codon:yes gene_type:complete
LVPEEKNLEQSQAEKEDADGLMEFWLGRQLKFLGLME